MNAVMQEAHNTICNIIQYLTFVPFFQCFLYSKQLEKAVDIGRYRYAMVPLPSCPAAGSLQQKWRRKKFSLLETYCYFLWYLGISITSFTPGRLESVRLVCDSHREEHVIQRILESCLLFLLLGWRNSLLLKVLQNHYSHGLVVCFLVTVHT